MDWDLGHGGRSWFLLALRKGCLLLMLFTKCLLHMQQPPLVNGRCCDINCSRVGHFGLTVQHLVVARGWGFCWGGATAASLWNVLISSPTCPPAPNIPFLCLSLALPSSSCFYPDLHFPSGGSWPLYIWEKKVTLFVIFLAGFSLGSDIVQECMMGTGRAITFCLNSTLLFCGPIPAGV